MSSLPPTVPPATPPPPGGGSYTPPPPPPPGAGAPAGSDRTLMIVLSYLGIFALIPLLTKKDDAEIQWHAKSGFVLGCLWFLVFLAFQLVGWMLPWGIRFAWHSLGCLVYIGFLVVDLICMVKGINGERLRLPAVGDIAERF